MYKTLIRTRVGAGIFRAGELANQFGIRLTVPRILRDELEGHSTMYGLATDKKELIKLYDHVSKAIDKRQKFFLQKSGLIENDDFDKEQTAYINNVQEFSLDLMKASKILPGNSYPNIITRLHPQQIEAVTKEDFIGIDELVEKANKQLDLEAWSTEFINPQTGEWREKLKNHYAGFTGSNTKLSQ
jgi:hypothetical protein